MPKAYWIARVDVHDPETYKNYVEAADAGLCQRTMPNSWRAAARPKCWKGRAAAAMW